MPQASENEADSKARVGARQDKQIAEPDQKSRIRTAHPGKDHKQRVACQAQEYRGQQLQLHGKPGSTNDPTQTDPGDRERRYEIPKRVG